MDIEKNNGQFLELCKTASLSCSKILPMCPNGKQKVITVLFYSQSSVNLENLFPDWAAKSNLCTEREQSFYFRQN